MRYEKDFNIRMSAAMFAAGDRDARARQQTISQYCRDALCNELKRDGIRVRPLRSNKQIANKAEAAA